MAAFNDLTIFSNPLSIEAILPFLLVFFIVFAVLQKSKVLDGKKHIDSLVALIVGLIVISFKYPVAMINQLIPFLAVVLIILFVFLMAYGMVSGKSEMHKYVNVGVGIALAITVLIAVLLFSGWWDLIVNYFSSGPNNGLLMNIVMIILVLAAFAIAWFGGGGDSGKSGK